MQKESLFAELILPVPLHQMFTYQIPDNMGLQASPGKRAIVQFGKKKLYSGIIRRIHTNKPDNMLVKELLEVIDESPVITDQQFQLWEWMSSYYMCSTGEVYKAAIPAGLRLESTTLFSYNEDFFDEEYVGQIPFSVKENAVLDFLKKGKTASLDEINFNLSVKNCMPVIKSLVEKGSIVIQEALEKGFRPKTEKYIGLTNEYRSNQKLNEVFEKLRRSPRQMELLTAYLEITDFEEGKEPGPILLKTLLEKCSLPSSVAGELVKKGVFELKLKNVPRYTFEQDQKKPMIFPLQDFQKDALKSIELQFLEKDTVLLHGITSSGKTEIYIHLIDKYLKAGKQVLYLLPEIALTSQIIERLRRAFGNKAGIYHSRFSDAERVETYQGVLGIKMPEEMSSFQLILGVRSAVFLPFTNLGLIIVDEEHESTFKQYNPAPRYQARDSAIVLAGLFGAKTLLGTATPSLESFYNAKTGKYGLVSINQRYLDISLPEIVLADIREARHRKQMKSHFTPQLLKQMELALGRDEQIILFQNRRGYAIYVECYECGWIPKCRYCDVSLTYHKHTSQMVCHYCGYAHSLLEKCHHCHSADLRTRGFGTEKVEDELKIFFPEAKIKRLDLDSARGKNAYSRIISDFENHKIDVLVGTQMVSKGLDFENVSLVGILDANQMLNYPDFRAYERSYQLMAQVGGRAGRKNKRGMVVIQTVSPENEIIKQVVENNYNEMFRIQVAERKQFRYPPFIRLINISLKHKNKEILNKAASAYASQLRSLLGADVIGPEFPVISKVFDLHIKNILIKLLKQNSIHNHKKFISDSAGLILAHPDFKGIQILFDVDPY